MNIESSSSRDSRNNVSLVMSNCYQIDYLFDNMVRTMTTGTEMFLMCCFRTGTSSFYLCFDKDERNFRHRHVVPNVVYLLQYWSVVLFLFRYYNDLLVLWRFGVHGGTWGWFLRAMFFFAWLWEWWMLFLCSPFQMIITSVWTCWVSCILRGGFWVGRWGTIPFSYKYGCVGECRAWMFVLIFVFFFGLDVFCQ